MGQILVGTSGWSYKDWVGVFYGSSGRWFTEYAHVFNITEINSTFYRYPAKDFAPGLARVSPKGFIFSAKLPKLITHEKKLDLAAGVEQDLEHFLKLMQPLKEEGKLGPLLIQLPPATPEELPQFEPFLKILPTDDYDFVAEFRDEAWLKAETFNLLRSHKVGYCIVDEPLLPAICEVTSDVGYIRWHGHGGRPWYYYHYSEEELKDWLPKLLALKERTKVLYAYFNNHFKGYAPKNALQMLQMLGEATPTQLTMLERIINYFTAGAIQTRKVQAQRVAGQADGSVKELLEVFLGDKRLARAMEIKDKELVLETIDENKIEAKIKNYHIIIDQPAKAIIHDCDDWKKRVDTKQFCKHVGKLFLSLPEDQALEILKNIAQNLDDWTFAGINQS